jgi:hypothetical protein
MARWPSPTEKVVTKKQVIERDFFDIAAIDTVNAVFKCGFLSFLLATKSGQAHHLSFALIARFPVATAKTAVDRAMLIDFFKHAF